MKKCRLGTFAHWGENGVHDEKASETLFPPLEHSNPNRSPPVLDQKKEVLEGEVVGTKSKKYMDLQKKMDEATNPDLRAARELNMETQGVRDAFDLNAANNISGKVPVVTSFGYLLIGFHSEFYVPPCIVHGPIHNQLHCIQDFEPGEEHFPLPQMDHRPNLQVQ